MPTRPGWYYDLRVVFDMTMILPAFLLPLYALILYLMWQQQPAQIGQITSAFELLLPLAGGLATAHLMVVEHEAGFADLRRSYPESSWRLPLMRTLAAVLWVAIMALIGILSFRVAYGEFDLLEVVSPAVAPSLYLLGWSLLVGNLTRNYWIVAAVVMGYWGFDYYTQGTLTQSIYLFMKTRLGSPDAAIISYANNRALLAALGCGLLLLNGYVNVRSRSGAALAVQDAA